MKKIVTALIIVLPIVLLIALFTVTGIARISADIPATGIAINNKGDGVIALDLSDYSSPLYESDLGIEVLPSMASNKEYTLSVTDVDGNATDLVTVDGDGAFKLNGIGIAKLTYTSRDGGYSDSVLFNILAKDALDFAIVLTESDDDIYIQKDTDVSVYVSYTAGNDNFAYNLSFDGEDGFETKQVDGRYVIRSTNVGEATLVMRWQKYDESGIETESGTTRRRIISVQGYSSLLFAENADSYGLGTLAIASKKYDENGNAVSNEYPAKFRAYDEKGNTVTLHEDDIEFVTSDPTVLSIVRENGKVYFIAHATGQVTVTARWKYGDIFDVKPATLTLQAVDGIEVDSDESIRRAFKNKTAVVLTDDVYLGENLFETDSDGARVPKYSDSDMREKLLEYTGEIKTTFDWQYFKNIGQAQPTVRYCLDITADIYGNGHEINAQYITDMLDSTDNPYDFALFKGPLDFVATNSEGLKLAAVKAQDNIVFLARTDGITIDNTVLKGCDDKTLYDDGAINLSLLNCMGTTLEIMADVTLTRSRVMNGRTAVRVFGRDGVDQHSPVNSEQEKIAVVIDGCVLQNAREFILKVGTNRVVRGTADNPSPSLTDASGKAYGKHNSSDCDSYIDDEYFMSQYVLTDVTLKDSILRTSGLFTIGMESHFSGPMLANSTGAIIKLDGWQDLAATSYPAILHLEGDVILADWKTLSSVDSSTLIECNTSQSNLAFLALDIAEMLRAVQSYGGDKYADLIADNDGVKYAHGGIAFYGGGKNYSILDTSKYTFEPMHNYNINLSILQKSSNANVSMQGWMLPLAAGEEDFRFVIFDGTSKFDYDAQNKK